MNKYSMNVNFDEQTAAIHRAKGIDPQEPCAIGPGIGPAAASPPPITPSLVSVSLAPPAQMQTANPVFSAAAVSSGPQLRIGVPETTSYTSSTSSSGSGYCSTIRVPALTSLSGRQTVSQANTSSPLVPAAAQFVVILPS